MSWSVFAVGKPETVKSELEKQFARAIEGTKTIPHEQVTVQLAQQAVDANLAFLVSLTNPVAVRVEGSGSAYKTSDGTGDSKFSIKVEPFGFLY